MTTLLESTGPRFVPVMVTTSESEPAVVCRRLPLKPVMVGATYDVRPAEVPEL